MKRYVTVVIAAAAFLVSSTALASAQTGRKSVPAAEVNGTFRLTFPPKFKGSDSEVKILALGGGRLHIAMDLVYPYFVGKELMANEGQLDGEAKIVGDTAVYESKEFGPCKITITFTRPGVIDLAQEGSDADCGFGHNVMADGTFRKVSSAKPKFDK